MAILYFDGDPAVGSDAWDDPLSWWTDSGATIPAGTTPANGDSVYIYGATAIASGPASAVSLALLDTSNYTGAGMDQTIFTSNITIASGGSLNFGGGTSATLTWGGTTVDATATMAFGSNANNVGTWSASAASFTTNSSVHVSGTITAPCDFSVGILNGGTVTGNCAFSSGGVCESGAITGEVTFADTSQFQSCTVTGDVAMSGSSTIGNSTTAISVIGNVTLNNSASFGGSSFQAIAVGGNVTLNNSASFGGSSAQTIAVGGNLVLNNSASIANANVTINVTGDTTFNSGTMGAAGSLNSTHIYYYGTASNTGLIEYATSETYYYGNATLAGGTSVPAGGVYFYNQSSMTSGTASGAIFNDASSFTGGNVVDSFNWTSAGTCSGGTVGGISASIVPLPSPTIACNPSGGLATSTTFVTLYARGLIQSGATVTFGGVAATSVSFVSSDELFCVAPTGTVGNVTIVITNPDGSTITQGNAFTYYSSGGGLISPGRSGGFNG